MVGAYWPFFFSYGQGLILPPPTDGSVQRAVLATDPNVVIEYVEARKYM